MHHYDGKKWQHETAALRRPVLETGRKETLFPFVCWKSLSRHNLRSISKFIEVNSDSNVQKCCIVRRANKKAPSCRMRQDSLAARAQAQLCTRCVSVSFHFEFQGPSKASVLGIIWPELLEVFLSKPCIFCLNFLLPWNAICLHPLLTARLAKVKIVKARSCLQWRVARRIKWSNCEKSPRCCPCGSKDGHLGEMDFVMEKGIPKERINKIYLERSLEDLFPAMILFKVSLPSPGKISPFARQAEKMSEVYHRRRFAAAWTAGGARSQVNSKLAIFLLIGEAS